MAPLRKPHRRFSVELPAQVQVVVPAGASGEGGKRVPQRTLFFRAEEEEKSECR